MRRAPVRKSAAPAETRGTPDQRRAIETVGTDVCVVAGAGTGKTFVLTERLVKRVSRDGVGLGAVLAITFTEKAAAEMKDRLARALEAAGMAGARAAVDAAAISTVHACCARLLREHAVAAGVDPGFRVLDEIESDRLLRAALDRLVDEWRESDREAFETLAALGGDDPAETLVAVYREAQSSGREIGAFVRDVAELPAAAPLVAKLRESLAALPPLAGTGTAAAQRNVAATLAAAASLPRGAATEAELERAVVTIDAATKINCGEPAKAALVLVREAAREALPVLAEHAMRPLREVLARAVLRLDALYDDEKGRGERLDFADLERRAVALLEARPGVRDDVRARRPEVLVDEFQDTNPVQARLVDLLRTPGRLFVVGDPKQAIYGFRGADVSVFEDRLRAVAAEGHGGVVTLSHSFRSRPEVLGFVNRLFEAGVGRSDGARPGMFDAEAQRRRDAESDGGRGERRQQAEQGEQGERGEPGGRRTAGAAQATDAASDDAAHDVAADVRLVAGRAWPPAAAPAVEVHVSLAPSMPDARAAEARWIADRIVALVESGLQVTEPTDADPLATRPAGFGDVAVLMRATTHVKVLEQALVARDVPYLVVKGRGFFRAREVVDVAHLLACVENPRDDLSLAAVLRSPACGLSDDGLFALTSRRAKGTALFDVVHAAAADASAAPDLPPEDAPALRRFAAVFGDLRARRATDGVLALVERAFAGTRLDVLALGRPNGRQRAANLRKIRTLAREADEDGLSVREFVDELKTLRAREVREAEASVAGGARGAVSLMSVHAAKGLEFRVVFVPDVGRTEIHRGDRVVADVRGGVGLRGWRGAAHDTPPWLHARLTERKKAAEAAESERLLYVAVTRAAEHLVLTGALTRDAGPPDDDRPDARAWWRKVSAAVGIDAPPAEDVVRDVGPAPAATDDSGRALVRVCASRTADPAGAAVPKTLLGAVASRLAAGVVPARPLRPEALREAAALLDEASRRAPPPDGTPFATNVSALTAFARCPQEYRLRHVVGVPEDSFDGGRENGRASDGAALFGARTAFDADEPAPEDRERAGDDEFETAAAADAVAAGPSSRALGRAVHAALERLVPAFRTEIGREVESALRAETGGAAPDPREVAKLSAWIERFRESEIGCEVAAAPRADVRREQAFLLRAGRTVVRGQVDLLWRGPRGWSVVDYKTGAVAASGHEHALQMRLYALGVRAVTGALPARLALWSLPLARAVDIACAPADVAEVDALLAEFARRTAASAFEPRRIPPCASCRVRAACHFAPR